MKRRRILGIVLVMAMMILVGVLLPAGSTTASAHTVPVHPARVEQVRGDYLGVNRERRGCVYTVHFTLSRQMRFDRHFRVTGPDRPVLLWVRGNQAVAAYQYADRCFPDRHHQAWQFVLIGY